MARKLQIRGDAKLWLAADREEWRFFSLSGDNEVDTSEGREGTTGERMADRD